MSDARGEHGEDGAVVADRLNGKNAGPGVRAALLERLVPAGGAPDLVALSGAALGLGALVAMFWSSLVHMVWTWTNDENYSHGFLVPALSLYFANEAAKRGSVTRRGGMVIGVVLLLACLCGRLLTSLVPIGIVSDLAFLLGLAGLVAVLAGREALARYGFALFFLVFMVPLPIALYSAIASPLQLLVSRMGSNLLNMMGIPVLCQGNMMTLPGDVQLFVAEACSGMRQLTGFLALTTAVAWFSGRPFWYRAILVASAIPIALTANVLRVTLTAWLAYAVDPALARGQFHTAEGLLLMGVGLAMLWAECQVLNGLFPAAGGGARATKVAVA
jgi:exosortase